MYKTEIKNFIEIITKKKRHINLKSSIELIKVIENLNTLKL